MNEAERALRGEIIRTCQSMEVRGINQATSGNVSARWEDGLLITPSGIPYDTMVPEDIVFMTFDGIAHGVHAPSTEWRMHCDIMEKRSDVAAIVHGHPPYLTGLSILNKDVPAVHYMIAAVGGPSIRCAKYATFGTSALSQNALIALEDRLGCILSNHGAIACGADLDRALWLVCEMETIAQQYAIALQAGKPVILSDKEIADVVERFKDYGPNRAAEPGSAGASGANGAVGTPRTVAANGNDAPPKRGRASQPARKAASASKAKSKSTSKQTTAANAPDDGAATASRPSKTAGSTGAKAKGKATSPAVLSPQEQATEQPASAKPVDSAEPVDSAKPQGKTLSKKASKAAVVEAPPPKQASAKTVAAKPASTKKAATTAASAKERTPTAKAVKGGQKPTTKPAPSAGSNGAKPAASARAERSAAKARSTRGGVKVSSVARKKRVARRNRA